MPQRRSVNLSAQVSLNCEKAAAAGRLPCNHPVTPANSARGRKLEEAIEIIIAFTPFPSLSEQQGGPSRATAHFASALVCSAVGLIVPHAPGARPRRLVCCLISLRVLLFGRYNPFYDHVFTLLSLCRKRKYAPERVVLFSQVTVLAPNTPNPN